MKLKRAKGDLFIILFLLMVGLGALIYNKVIVPRQGQGAKVLVEIDGKIMKELDLSRDVDGLRFSTKHGYNVVEIKDGKVRVSEADCPDLICVNTGWRGYSGQMIVCMPHRFLVKIVGDGESAIDLDGFSY